MTKTPVGAERGTMVPGEAHPVSAGPVDEGPQRTFWGPRRGGGWFTRYGTGANNTGPVTTLWEFSIDGLTEDQAAELDRCIRALVEEFKS